MCTFTQTHTGIIAVACGEIYSIEERIDLSSRLLKKPSLILIWSFTDPIHPQLFLEAPDDIVCFQFNPTDPNVVVGGCINGQIVLWDIHEYQDKLQLNRTTDASEMTRGVAATLVSSVCVCVGGGGGGGGGREGWCEGF